VSQLAEQNHHKTAMCPKFEEAASLLGKKWTGLILHVLLTGSTRFKEIKEMVPQMSDKMLAERLKELEESGIIERKVYPEIPVRIEYQLTAKGKDLEIVVASIREWGDRWM
jgi:DNA-binding HxlR family transcriptional regulator